MSFDTPILFLVFNRPDTTAKVFEKIREIKPARLFVAADGPRPGKEGEAAKCGEVRKLILDGIDWTCDVKTLFRDSNMGCGRAVSEASKWFFNSAGEGIVLEDDTLPDSSFFKYCKDLLAYYRNDESIKMIGGCNFQKGKIRGDGSYYFSDYIHGWGYASWQRAWKNYDFKLDQFTEESFELLLEKKIPDNIEREYWKKIYRDILDKKYDTWDFQFLFSMWQENAKSIIPNKNLVTNIGFGNNATHTAHSNDPAANIPLSSLHKIVHPSSSKVNSLADRYFFSVFMKPKSKWERRLKRILSWRL